MRNIMMYVAVLMAVGCGAANQEWVCDCTTESDNYATEICGTDSDAVDVTQAEAEGAAAASCESADAANGTCACACELTDAPDDGSNTCETFGGTTNQTTSGTTATGS